MDERWNIKGMNEAPFRADSFLVSDFGLSKEREDWERLKTMTACGTPAWAAPEVLKFQKYTLQADCFSFGVSLWEMFIRKIPHGELPPSRIIIGVATEVHPSTLHNTNSC